jgi:hypothetical protein
MPKSTNFWKINFFCILEICSKIKNYMLHASSPQIIIPKKITNIIQNLFLFFQTNNMSNPSFDFF